MTPGEMLIYDHIIDANSHDARMFIQCKVTNEIFRSYAEKEIERIISMDAEINEIVAKKLDSPLAEKYGYRPFSGMWDGALGLIINNLRMLLYTDDYSPSKGGCELKNISTLITYDKFTSHLVISKDVAKNCIERLIERGKISRQKGMCGYSYSVDTFEICKEIIKHPGSWSPIICEGNWGGYKEDKSLWPIMNTAQKSIEPIQKYYERQIKEICEPYLKNIL